MVSRLKPAIESTPVSDSAVGQEDKTTPNRDRKRKSSDVNEVQEEVGCPGQKSRRLSHASSRPEGRHAEYPSQTSLVLTTSAPLGRQPHHGTNPHIDFLPHTRTILYPTTTNNLTLEPSLYDSEAGDANVAQFGLWPQGPGNKKQFSFFDFPPEIRNMIYDHSLYWPDCVDLYRSFYSQISAYSPIEKPQLSQYQYERTFRTPTVLLLCRRITEESLPILKSRCFVIDRLPPFVPGGLMKITDFIGQRTLQSLHHIDLRIGLGEGPLGSGWIWMRLLDELLTILKDRNAFVKLRLLVRLCDKQIMSRWNQERRYRKDIAKVCFMSTPVTNSSSRQVFPPR